MKRTQEELKAIVIPLLVENAVQRHINKIVTSMGYDGENSIAKYLVEGNPFYEECKKISMWIGYVWVNVYRYSTDVSQFISVEDIISNLPKLEEV